MFNLLMALFWLIGAVVVFVAEAINGRIIPMGLPLYGRPVSIGWMMVLFGLFTLVRWWAIRTARATQLAQWQAREARRQRQESDHPPEGGKEPDPNFQFDDSPQQPAPISQRPPSEN